LETQVVDILVEGELSGFKAATSGHMYFDLKDSGALIRCIMWASDTSKLKFRPDNGAKVELRGRLTVYDQRGQYQLCVTTMRPAGLGKLYQAFLEMKERLTREGLFSPEHKKPLPPHPNTIGIVTSPTGAAVQDMLNILTRRAPHIHVYIWPVRVQGDGSANEIARAVKRFNELTPRVDVLIVGRGGGSLEDLWAFNEEVVARSIFESEIPVISAVGHETDVSIADFVADLRAPTPSAAAELVARDSSELIKHLHQLQGRAYRAMREHSSFLRQTPHLTMRLESAILPRLQQCRSQLTQFERSYGIQMPLQRVNQGKQHHDSLMDQIKRTLRDRMQRGKNRFAQCSNQLRTLNPKAILKRGYSITYDARSQKIIQSSTEVANGTLLTIILGSGQISAHAGSGTGSPPRAKKRGRKGGSQNAALEWFGTETPDDY
jgi:exodeoxyribonuclease VII large subunit